jgi:hypothetical protein
VSRVVDVGGTGIIEQSPQFRAYASVKNHFFDKAAVTVDVGDNEPENISIMCRLPYSP